jgi:hypothetical protein
MSDEKCTQSVPSINDNLQTSNPSAKSIIVVLSGLALAAFVMMLYFEYVH